MGFWTKEKTDELEFLWRGEDSASVIAAALGTTRNAVLGKVHRLGLPERAISNQDFSNVSQRERRSVFKARELQEPLDHKVSAPKVLPTFSALTGHFVSVRKRPPDRERSKQELRDMLREAVTNTK